MSVIDVDIGTEVPVAFSGLHRLLDALRDRAPRAVARAAEETPETWSFLFPGSVEGAPRLRDVALSPSERRLHRESEQIFRSHTVAARFIQEALREAGASLHVRNAGAADLVSLRALMRLQEWLRLVPDAPSVSYSGWSVASPLQAASFRDRRDRFLSSLIERMRLPAPGAIGASPLEGAQEATSPPVADEARYQALVAKSDASPEHRIAAAVLVIRECFFSTNYEGAMLAAEVGLDLLRSQAESLSTARLVAAWDELDTGSTTAAIEVDRDCLEDLQHVQALFHRCIGVVRSFSGENDAALAAFEAGLRCNIRPERQGQLRMFCALSLVKRMADQGAARAQAEQGIAVLAGRNEKDTGLHEAWLRNVCALTYVYEKNWGAAVREEQRALDCLAGLSTPSATHLKVNLITNFSVLQESTGRRTKAIETWRRFESSIEHWDDNFHKHHRYRLGALYRKAGEWDAALESYGKSYEKATTLRDWFNQQVIASDVGQCLLQLGRSDEAMGWFERATRHALEYGEPLRAAEGLAGQVLAGAPEHSDEAAGLAALSSTYPREAEALRAALADEDREALRACLPKPRNKLNRPFDVVNLY